jgi:hypothetical protein
LRIRYEITLPDIVAFKRYALRRSQGWGSLLLWIGAMGFLAWVYLGLDSPEVRAKLFVAAILLLLFSILYGGIVFGFTALLLSRRVRRLYENSSALGWRELEFTGEGFFERSELSEARCAWRALQRIVSTKDHTFIYVGPEEALVLPRHSVSEGDYDAFVGTLRREWESRRLATVSQTPPSCAVHPSYPTALAANSPQPAADAAGPTLALRPMRPTETRHSGLGIASFVIALLTGVIYTGIIAAVMIHNLRASEPLDRKSPLAVLIALAVITANFLNVVGLLLGICGLVQRDRRRSLALVGFFLNALIITSLLLIRLTR